MPWRLYRRYLFIRYLHRRLLISLLLIYFLSMKLLLSLFLTHSFLLYAMGSADKPFTVSSEIFNTDSLAFEPHVGKGPLGSYVILKVPYGPAEQIFNQIKYNYGVSIQTRGEAHITVITPPEFSDALGSVLKIEEINQIVTDSKIQQAHFSPVCVGRARATIDDKSQSTYYVVVSSPELVSLRGKIFDRYLQRGGEPSRFDPEHFYPHITVGFTLRDLQEQDGVYKGRNSCIGDVILDH